MKGSQLVAIAVVSWNTRELLAACLRSLEGCGAEVWVVDNASTDGSAAMVREQFPWAQLIESAENLGYGRAVNAVAQRTQTTWLAALNADVELEPGALDTLVQTGRRSPRAGALAPRLILPDGTVQHSVHPFPTLRFTVAFNAGLAPRALLEGRWDPDVERDVDWAHGALLIIRREAWDAVGGFDPAMWLYAEDLDLCWRLHEAGWNTRYVPSAHVRHAVSAATVQAFGEDRLARSQAAAYAWMRRRRGTQRTAVVGAANVAGAWARALALALPARVLGGRWAWRRDRARAWAAVHRDALRRSRSLRP